MIEHRVKLRVQGAPAVRSIDFHTQAGQMRGVDWTAREWIGPSCVGLGGLGYGDLKPG